MTEKHWFDTLNATLVQDADRRGLLRAAGALLAGLGLGSAGLTARARRKNRGNDKEKQVAAAKKGGKGGKGRKGKDKGKGKGKDKEKPQTCSGGECQAIWPNDRSERDWCEFICQQCDGDDARNFCIANDYSIGTPVAQCCTEGEQCCGGTCCDKSTGSEKCCGDQCCPLIPGVSDCCDDHCISLMDHPAHCGGCHNPCPGGYVCDDGFCVCESSDCGAPIPGECRFDVDCPPGLPCRAGKCACAEGYKLCRDQGFCIRDSEKCCKSDQYYRPSSDECNARGAGTPCCRKDDKICPPGVCVPGSHTCCGNGSTHSCAPTSACCPHPFEDREYCNTFGLYC